MRSRSGDPAVVPRPVPTGNTYDKYATTNPVERGLMTRFLSAVDAVLPAQAPHLVLEVGAGEGEITDRVRSHYPSARLVAVDLLDDTLATDWRKRNLAGVFADIATLPFPDDSADLVLAIEVLEHVPNPVAALRELARVATSHVVLSVPREPLWRLGNVARGAYLRSFGNTPGHINHWSARSFVRLVNRWFDVSHVAKPFPWTLVGATARPHPQRRG